MILPLAAETNAVIFCEAKMDCCMLTEAFFRVVDCCRARWGGARPASATHALLVDFKAGEVVSPTLLVPKPCFRHFLLQ